MSNELGAGHPKSAAFSVIMVNLCSFVIAVIAAILVMMLRDYLSYAFTEGEVVSKAVSQLSPFLAVTIILNGVQPVLSGKVSYFLFSFSLSSMTAAIFDLFVIINMKVKIKI